MAKKAITKLSELTPDANNYNKGTEFGGGLIEKSLRKLGAGRSILLDKNGKVIAGNKTLENAVNAGFGDDDLIVVQTTGKQIVAVQRMDLDLDSRMGKEMALADNATAKANIEWDVDALNADWNGEELADWGIDGNGWANGDNSLNSEAVEDDFDVPDIEEVKTDIVTGDLIEIGTHRLLCGDSSKSEDVDKLMIGRKADMVFTDPPYGVSIGAKNRMLNSFQKSGRNLTDIKDDGLKPEELKKMLLPAFVNLRRIMSDDCTVFVTAPQVGDLCMMMMMMMGEAGLKVRHVLIWKKDSPTFSMGRLDYEYQHEPILLTWGKRHKYYGGGQHKTSVWEIPKPRANKEHPTMKPVALVANAMLNNSKKADVVVDFYLGSGTTIVAAEQLERSGYGIEIDPRYCQVIVDRMVRLNPEISVKKNGIDYLAKS